MDRVLNNGLQEINNKNRQKTYIEFSYADTWTKSYSFVIDTNDKAYLKIYFPYEKKGDYEVDLSQDFINNFKLKVSELKLDTNIVRYDQPSLSDGTGFHIYKESNRDTSSVYVYGKKAPKKVYSIAFYLDSLVEKAVNLKKINIKFQVKTAKNFEIPVELLREPPHSE